MQHLVQANGNGYHSQNPRAEVVAARSAAQNAISENEKIFPVFAQRLASSDPKEFINTARKFSIWLSSERAYYPAARPKIVELLEIALSAFVNTFVHHSAIAEIAEHMRQLVQAVDPFKHLFRENELQSRLQRVIFDSMCFLSRLSSHATAPSEGPAIARYIGLSPLNTHNPNWGRIPTSVPSPTHTSPVNPYPTMPSVPDHHMFVWRAQPSLPISRLEKVGSVGVIHADQSRARNSFEVEASSQPEAAPRFTPSITIAQSGEGIPPTIPSKLLPKCTQRAELLEDPIARDLDWSKSDQSAILKKDLHSPSTTAGQHSPPSNVPHAPKQSPTPKKKTARMVPFCRLPRRLPIAAAQVVDPDASISISPESLAEMVESSEDEGEVFAPMDQMDIDGESAFLERIESSVCSVAMPETNSIQQVSRAEDMRFSESQPATTPSNVSSVEQQMPQIDHRSYSVEDLLVSGETSLPRPSISFAAHALNGVESIDAITAASNLRSELYNRLEPNLPQSPQPVPLPKPVLPPLVKALDPPLNLNFGLPHQWAGTGGNERRFDDEMSILHSVQGMPFTHTHMINIGLNETIFSKISKWVERRSHPSEESERVCISLACYRIPELVDNVLLENGKPDVRTLTAQSSCSWPSSNRLSLCIKDGERHTTIVLSPPLVLTPDQCVDISWLMKPGHNTLEIRQKDDLSEYLVVFHAHPPTRSQLAELEVVKSADERWRRLLDVLSGRVAPGKVLGNTPADVVG